MMFHKEMMQLIIGYAFTGVIVFTAVLTVLSLVGWVKIVDSSQQKKLFSLLIVELVGIAVTFFAGFIRFDAAEVAKTIEISGKVEGVRIVSDRVMSSIGVQLQSSSFNDGANLAVARDMITDIIENTSKYFSKEQSVNDRVEIFADELTNQLSKTLKVTEQKGIEQGIAILGHEFAVFIREMPIARSDEYRDLLNNLATRLDEMNSIDDVAEFAELGKNFTSQFTEYVTEIENRAIQQSFESIASVIDKMRGMQVQVSPQQLDTLIGYMNDMRSFEEPQLLEEGANLFERLESFTIESEKLF